MTGPRYPRETFAPPESTFSTGGDEPNGSGNGTNGAPEDNVDETHSAPVELFPYLRLHGIEHVHEHRRLGDKDAGREILSLAGETAADLIVMGCYGHGRARELVLGGASRTVLESMRVPVLMSH